MHLSFYRSPAFCICVLPILVTLLFPAASASAQAAPLSLRLAPELALALEHTATGPAKAPTPRPEDEKLRQLKEGRARLTAGLSLLLGGLMGAAIGLAGQTCYGDTGSSPNVAMATSGMLVGAVGVGFTVSGLTRMKGITKGDRQRHKAPGWLVLLGVATTAASFITVMALGLPEALHCSDS